MKVLVLEPFLGGSHLAFIEGWQAHSRHSFTVLGYPPHKWKWRMRHSGYTLASQVNRLHADGNSWDVLFCSDMLNLAEFYGFATTALRRIPSVVYFHENQLTYPVRQESERDIHFGFTNYLTAMAADSVWFNSEFHRRSFLTAAKDLLGRMPDHADPTTLDDISDISSVMPQGIGDIPRRPIKRFGTPRIVWAARWEHDKNPELFFQVLYRLDATGTEFELSVLGEQFDESPEAFKEAQKRLARHIVSWGYREGRDDYLEELLSGDIFVSTADHEFFGVSVVEATAAGCYPLLPQRLAYPEVIGLTDHPEASNFFYDGSADQLAQRLGELLGRYRQDALWTTSAREFLLSRIDQYRWSQLATVYDEEIDRLVERGD